MKLEPTEPPGHAARKLRGLVSEIARLRAESYTIKAIHQALSAKGIEVGWSTVQREVARLQSATLAVKSPGQPAHRPAHLKKVAPAVHATTHPEAAERSMAAAAVDVDSYFDQHRSNPLFRNKGKKL